MRVLLLTNPHAGLKGSACPLERFLPTMQAWGWTVDTQPTSSGPRLAAMAYQAAQDGFDAREELHGVEGLREVVVGAAPQAPDAVGIVPAGGEHDDGHVGSPLANAPADLEAVGFGQHDIEKHQIGALVEARHAGGRTIRPVQGVAMASQEIPQELRQVVIVVDKQ